MDVYYGQTLSLPTPTRTGYRFGKWLLNYTEFAMTTYTRITDTHLLADWCIIYYAITYDVDEDVELSPLDPTDYTVEDPDITLHDPSRYGYDFAGWSNGGTIAHGSTGEKTFTASWTPIESTITLDVNGGDVLADSSLDVNYGLNVTLPTPTWTGHTFLGWYDGEELVASGAWEYIENVTLVAHWELTKYQVTLDDVVGGFDVSFNLNGASGRIATQRINSDNSLVYPSIPEREDYIFGGWYDNVECSGDPFDFSADVLADVQLYAKWVAYEDATPISFATSIAIHVNSSEEDWAYYAFVPLVTGTLEYEAQSVAPGYHIDLCDDEKGELAFHDSISGRCTVTAGELYYLRYQSVSEEFDFFVSLEMEIAIPEDGGSNSEPNKEVVLIEYSSSYTLPVPSKYGYAFEGWYDGEGGTGTQYTDDAGNGLSTWNDVEDKTLYALWTPIPGRITLDVNGGDALAENTLDVVFDEELTLPTPTRTGYTFVGWYNGEEIVVDGPYSYIGNSTFVAHWEPNKYPVELREAYAVVLFDLNDGRIINTYQCIDDSATLEYPTIPTRDGYIFAGWYDTPECDGDPFDFSADVTGLITLYAKWIEIPEGMDGVIYVGDSIAFYFDGENEIYYAFVPLVSGEVVIYSMFEIDTFGTLYDADFVDLYASDDDGEGNNFSITYDVVAGTLYIIGFKGFGSGSGYEGDGDLVVSGYEPVDGGECFNGGVYPAEVTYDAAYQLLVPARYGYTFLGWFDGEDGTGTQYTDGLGNSLTEWTLTEGITLYPYWEVITSTVTLDVNEGDALLEDSITLDFGDELTLPTPTRAGYEFTGWDNGTEIFDAGTYYYNGIEDITLVATWEIITYTISYELDGGEVEGENPTTYTVETEDITLISPEKYGYDFLGWDNGEVIPQGSTGNKTFTALWAAIESVITLDVNEGDALLEDTIDIAYEEELVLPTPTRTGYTFMGWFDEEEEYNNGVYYNIEDITLVAHWEPTVYNVTLDDIIKTVTVSFNLNGAEGAIDDQVIQEGVTLVYPDTPLRDGYIFAGWYRSPDCEGELFNFNADLEYSTVLYAKWIELPDYVEGLTFVGDCFELYINGTTIHYYAFVPFVSGEVIVESSFGFDTYGYLYSATGSTLTRDDDSGESANFKYAYSVTAGELYIIGARAYSSGSGNGTIAITGACPMDGGTIAVGGSLVVGITYDEAFAVSIPEKTGYTFLGWYDGVGGTGTKYTDEFGQSVIDWDKASDATLYAKWEAIHSTVTLDVNGGDDLLETEIDIAYDADLVLPTPTWTGHDFLGWYNGEELVESCLWQGLEDITLVAQWELSKYEVTLFGVDGVFTVSFDTNEGNEDIESQFISDEVGLVYPSIPTKDGYLFAGWYDNVELEGSVFDFTQTITSDLTLYAKWLTYSDLATPIVYGENTINIIGGGGVTGTQFFAFVPLETCRIIIRVGKNAYISCSSNNPTPGNNYAGGVYSTRNADVVAGQVYYISLQSQNNYSTPELTGEAYLNIAGNMPAAGGLGEDLPDKVVVITYSEEYTFDVPTKYGYTFAGWYDGLDGSGTQYTDAEGHSLAAWTTLEDKTLYPKWVAIPSVITLDVNEGDELLETEINIAYEEELTLPIPTRTNYSFAGWYDGETLVENGTYYGLENVTLVAHWTEYAIEFVGERTTGIYYTDELNSETLNVRAFDTDGTELPIVFTLTSGTIEIGNMITVSLRVEGKFDTVLEETMEDLKVFGDSTLTYDDTLDYINVAELGDIPTWFSAVALDTFGENLEVIGTIVEEEYAAGETITIVLSATNEIGREVTVQIDNIKLYDIPEIEWDEDKLEMRDDQEISLELFGITCVDSFGDPVDLTVDTIYAIEAGEIIIVSVVATDNYGNVGAVDLRVKVYGEPILVGVFHDHVKTEDVLTPEFLEIEVVDSFGVAIPYEDIVITTIDGVQVAGYELAITFEAYDHLDNCLTETVSGIRVCSNPVVTYDESITMISDNDSIDAELFRASALSTFNEELEVEVELASGELVGGNIVTFNLTATDEAGNTTTVTTGGIQVYSADDITFEYDDVQDLPIKVTSKGEEYHAVAYDSFGGLCELELVVVGGSDLEAGTMVNIQIVATDLLGNVALSEEIVNAYIYGMPTISYLYDSYYMFADDNPLELFTLYDSFNAELDFDLVIDAELSSEFVKACHITGTDEAGNVYDEVILLDIVNENETVLHIFINGEEISTINQSELTEYTLPRYTGYTTSWVLNDVDMGDDASDYVTITHDGSAASFYAYGTKVANHYVVLFDGSYAIVHFESNGGSVVEDQIIDEDTTLQYPEDPTKDGFAFAGWYESSEFEGELFDFSAELTKDVTLYAKWIELGECLGVMAINSNIPIQIEGLTLKYYAFVPLLSGNITVYTTSSIDTYGFLYNASMSQLTSNDDGGSGNNFRYTYNVTAGMLYYIGARAYSTSTGPATLYLEAENTPLDGGYCISVGPSHIEVTYDQNFVAPIPEKVGYTFLGWYDEEDGAGTLYTDELGNSVKVWDKAADAILYPCWQAISSTITLDVNEGDDLLETEIEIAFDEELTLPTPTRTGYTFMGWYNGEVLVESGIYQGVEDATLFAHWEANQYTITLDGFVERYTVSFNLNGAEGEIADQIIDHETPLTYPAIPTRADYLFGGWYDNAECEGEPFDFSAYVVEDVTLYAKWLLVGGNGVIELNTTLNLSVPSVDAPDFYYYAFVPLVSGHLVYSTMSSSNPYYIDLCNSAKEAIGIHNTNSGSYDVIAGELYYIRYKSVSSTFTIRMKTEVDSVLPADGGIVEGTIRTAIVAYDSPYELLVQTRTGYTFLGWFDGVDGTGTQYTDLLGYSLVDWADLDNKTLYAKWEAIASTITLDVNEGDALLETEIAAVFDSEVTLPTPTRTGYTFVGWYNGETLVESGIYQGYEDVTLVAQWEVNLYNVTLDGVYGGYIVSFNTLGGSEVELQQINNTTTLSYPSIPTKDGAIFGGWYDNEACEGDPFDFSAEVKEDVTLYAKWLAAENLASRIMAGEDAELILNGTTFIYFPFVPLVSGNVTVYSTSSYDTYGVLVNGDKSNTLVTDDDSGDGNNFMYIYGVTAGTLYYIGVRAYSSSTHGNATLHITGTALPTDGGTATIDPVKVVKVAYSSSYVLDIPTYYGYNFMGWFDGEGGTGNQYTDAEGHSLANWTLLENKTLYAKWELVESTITFDPNGGVLVDSTPITLLYGDSLTLPTPTRDGYTFAGWYDGEDLIESGTWNGIEDVELLAHWTPNTYTIHLGDKPEYVTVSFDLNGADGSIESQHVNDVDALVYPEIPERENYIFGGWYEDSSCTGDPYDFTQELTGDLLLYAKWLSADNIENVITAGEEKAISINGTTLVYYPFVPLVSGQIVFETSSSLDTYGVLYTANKVQLTYNDDGPTDRNFKITYNVIAGCLYYIAVRGYSSSYVGDATLRYTGEALPTDGGLFTAAREAYADVTFDAPYQIIIPDNYGYHFLGWYDGVGGTGTQYTDSEGNSLANWTGLTEITLYGKWEIVTVQVQYDVNGGDPLLDDSQNATYNANITHPTPNRTGYAFLGWYDGEELINAERWYGLSDTTLVAHWELIEYTINYVLNGGTLDEADPSTYNVLSETIVLHNPTRTGYNFTGWSDGGAIPQGSTGEKTFTASWEAIESVITLDVNGGDALVDNTVEVCYDMLLILEVPTRTGYTFLGWFNGEEKFVDGVYKGTEDVTLVAHWELTEYTINYVLGGGTLNEADPATYNILSETIVLHEPTRTGYTFTCWDNDGTIPQGSTGEKTFTASWTPIASTITLDVNEGDALLENTINTYYDALLALPTPTRTGYQFLGWFDGETQIEDGAYHGTEDVTLVASWSLIHYNINYVLGTNGVNNEGNPATYTILDDEIVLLDPERTGYDFLCWLEGNTIPAGSTGEMTFTASWEAEIYCVTLDVDGGDPLLETEIEVAYDEELELPEPTRTGYTFSGWYYDEFLVESGPYHYDEFLDLVAHWEANTYVVTLDDIDVSYTYSFDLNGAEGSIPDQVIDSSTLSYPEIPTRDGYIFGGWYDNQACEGDPFDFSVDVTQDEVLYAKWLTYSDLATPINLGENTINIIGGSSSTGSQFFAFVPLVSETITINVGKNAYINCRTDAPIAGSVTYGSYGTKSISVTAGVVYYIGLQSENCSTDPSKTGEANLDIICNLPEDGGEIGIDNYKFYEVTYDEPVIFALPNEIPEGYEFAGWYDGVGGTGNQITNAEGACFDVWDIPADTTLFAKFVLAA